MSGAVIGRRTLLAGLGLLAAGCAVPSATASGPASTPVTPRLHTDWTRRPTGPLPAAGDDGVPFVLRGSSVASPPWVDRGALVADLPDGRSALYVNQDLGAPVRRIGARWGFVPGPGGGTGDDGSLCLAAWNGPLPPADAGHHTAPVHLVLTPQRWIYGVVVAGLGVRPLAEGWWPSPPPTDGTPLRIDVVLDGPRAVLTLPDGSTRQIHDPAIERPGAPTACWEFYRNAPGGAAIRLYETWAG